MKDLIINGYAYGSYMQAARVKGASDERQRLKMKWLKVLERTNLLGLTL
jgi:hypothetical protein